MAKKILKNKLESTKELPPIDTFLETGKEISITETETIKAACKRLNLSIDDYVKAIKDALSATRTTIDKYGDEHIEDDHDKRLKAALIGLELEGYIKNKAIATDNSKHTHVTYSWQPVQIITAEKNRLVD